MSDQEAERAVQEAERLMREGVPKDELPWLEEATSQGDVAPSRKIGFRVLLVVYLLGGIPPTAISMLRGYGPRTLGEFVWALLTWLPWGIVQLAEAALRFVQGVLALPLQ